MSDYFEMTAFVRAQEAAEAQTATLARPEHSPARDRAWGRFYGMRGLRPCVPASSRDLARPLSNPERIYRWRMQYDRVPIDMQTQPIRR